MLTTIYISFEWLKALINHNIEEEYKRCYTLPLQNIKECMDSYIPVIILIYLFIMSFFLFYKEIVFSIKCISYFPSYPDVIHEVYNERSDKIKGNKSKYN